MATLSESAVEAPRGELIGINTAIIAHGSEGNQGIGFAIPVNMARSVMDQLVKYGKVTRGYLGIIPQNVTPAMAKAFGENETQGALVGDVSPNSPAQKAGLERGDIILDVNGKPVANSNDLRMNVSMLAPGTDVNLRAVRNWGRAKCHSETWRLSAKTASVKPENEQSHSLLSGVDVQTSRPKRRRISAFPPTRKVWLSPMSTPLATPPTRGYSRAT